MGINMNLAPVVDVNTNPLNPVIGVRAFGSDVGLVSRFGAQTIDGLQGAGVSAVAKHFPGHGDTATDSHLELPVVNHARGSPADGRAGAVRGSHCRGRRRHHDRARVRSGDRSRPDVPATLSRAVLTGVLREQLGYQGLILTDALDMDAIKRDRSAAEAAIEAFEAGADLLLIAGIARTTAIGWATGHRRCSRRCAPDAFRRAARAVGAAGAGAKARRGILPGAWPRPCSQLDRC